MNDSSAFYSTEDDGTSMNMSMSMDDTLNSTVNTTSDRTGRLINNSSASRHNSNNNNNNTTPHGNGRHGATTTGSRTSNARNAMMINTTHDNDEDGPYSSSSRVNHSPLISKRHDGTIHDLSNNNNTTTTNATSTTSTNNNNHTSKFINENNTNSTTPNANNTPQQQQQSQQQSQQSQAQSQAQQSQTTSSSFTGEWKVEEARIELRNAVRTLSQRGLNLASKWASEQLIGLAPPLMTSPTTSNAPTAQTTTTTSNTSIASASAATASSYANQHVKGGKSLGGTRFLESSQEVEVIDVPTSTPQPMTPLGTTNHHNKNNNYNTTINNHNNIAVGTTTTTNHICINEQIQDLELYAKSLLDLGEYFRAASLLSDASSSSIAHGGVSGGIGVSGGLAGGNGMMGMTSTGIETNEYGAAAGGGGGGMGSTTTGIASGSGTGTGAGSSNTSDLAIPPPIIGLSSYGLYIRAYALYMAGERRKEEEILELRDPLERTTMKNRYLNQLTSELYELYHENALDAFGLYIYGIVLKEVQKSPSNSLSNHYPPTLSSLSSPRTTIIHKYGIIESSSTAAHAMLIQSLISYPYNWSAWLDLGEMCISDPSIHGDVEEFLKPISLHWMYHFFCVHVFLENSKNDDAIMIMDRLIHGVDDLGGEEEDVNVEGGGYGDTENPETAVTKTSTTIGEGGRGLFIQSPYLQSQLAVAHYNMRDFDTAQEIFLAMSERDPQRLDQMDVYSNILYVKENKIGLSQLAHRAVKIDKYRPETCCIVGNYYSLKSQHEKAVQYFQRALKLDRSYLSAWTLMGHEFLEMKNTAAAIEAYRRAVDINPRDYRAWYGLGQTYEIMNMFLYALFYYRKAVELRPYDARMWSAMGGCYLNLDRRADAIRSYEKAVSNHDAEGIATKTLASLYREDGNMEQAAQCYLSHLKLRYQAQSMQQSPDLGENDVELIITSVNVDKPEAEALLYLAFYYRDHDELDVAYMCCSRLLDYPGPEKEQGKALLREIRSRRDGKSKEMQSSRKGGRSKNDSSFDFSP